MSKINVCTRHRRRHRSYRICMQRERDKTHWYPENAQLY